MPAPALPNELITLIFEHLFRQLSVHPAEEFLDVPLNAPFVFLPFTLVSKTWHALASPFLYRHLTTAQLVSLSQRMPAPLLQYQPESLYWNRGNSGIRRSGVESVDRFDGWFQSVAEHVITARCSECRRERRPATVDFLFSKTGEAHNFPALTRLRLDYSYGEFPGRADTILDILAGSAPNIEHLTLVGAYRLESDRYAPWDHSPRPFTKLRILELRNFYLIDVEYLGSAVVEQLIRPHRTTLEHLSFDIRIEGGVSPSFTAVLPFSLPRLRNFSCTRPATGAQTVDLPALLPSLTDLTLPLPDVSASLPSLPPALHRLCILSIHPENFTSVVQQVTSLLTSSGQTALSAVRILAFDTHEERTPDPLSTAQETLRRLVDVCNTRGVTLQSNILLDVLTEDQDHPERFLQLGRTQFRGLAGPSSSRTFEDEDEDTRASQVWLEGDYDPVAAEEDEASSAEEEEEELDWDAEEDVQFRELWTDDKRRAWDLSQALGTCNLDSP